MIINKKLTERKVIWSCRLLELVNKKQPVRFSMSLTTSSSLHNAMSKFRVNFRIVVAVSIILIRSKKTWDLFYCLLIYMQLICDRLLISQK